MSDLTRYRIDRQKVKEITEHEPSTFLDVNLEAYKDWGVLVSDDTLQQIADAWNAFESADKSDWDDPRSQSYAKFNELRTLLDGLVRVNGADDG